MSDALYAVYGASGLGKQVMPLVRAQLASDGVGRDSLVFVDDRPPSQMLNGHEVMTWDEFVANSTPDKYVAISIANSKIREKLDANLIAANVKPYSVQANNAVIMDDVKLGDGALLSCFVLLTSNIRIGRHFHANHYSHVAHDCVIGDFVTLAPGVRCNGNVHIDDHAYIGTGAILRQGTPDKPLRIGKGAVVGMGAVVTKDVPAGVTVVGNPARPFERR